jgi:hypothetical protein
MRQGARWQAEHYRDMAAHFRSLAETESLASLRRHLRQLAAQHEEVAAGLEEPHSDDNGLKEIGRGEADPRSRM